MCGINGFNFNDFFLIEEMNAQLHHRGPDKKTSYLNERLSLGHARLSIIDLSDAGNQPMFYEYQGRKVGVVFNGELYNYLELRELLLARGYEFSTDSDTEVLLVSYLEWGEECLRYFNGMWSFCLFDVAKQQLFCSRDRLGVKPFYYFLAGDKFLFSSELKSLVSHKDLNINTLANIDKEAVELFFSLGYIPAPLTIYKSVKKLEAGHNLIYDLRTNRLTKHYSYFEITNLKKGSSTQDLLDEGREILTDSVKLRMRSDVPVGAFLSGGLDSSTVVGEMKNFTNAANLHTFSIGFEEKKYDESHYINLVKDFFQTRHHHHIYQEAEFKDMWSIISDVFDEPFADYSAFASYSVCKLASDHVTVVLSGDGGDEIFGGYPIYSYGYIFNRIQKLPLPIRQWLWRIFKKGKSGSKSFKFAELLRMSFYNAGEFYSQQLKGERYKPDVFVEWTKEKLTYCLALAENDLAEALRIYDLLFNTLADNYLVKVDRTSMANSIEVRSPFLDYRFINYAQKIPRNLKVNASNNKILMRKIIKGIVPAEILTRSKMGFTPPIHTWLYNSISEEDFNIYLSYLGELNPGLFLFYQDLKLKGGDKNMKDFYMMKLAIFGRWIETWILKKEQVLPSTINNDFRN
jgi:asparagine synthase (glutamine-hydrolysing)